tara:strand:- start:429 stop:569 length:141 start_codon:yes stop_codon:yes gene_type:complete
MDDMTRKEFWEWMLTCPMPVSYEILQDEGDLINISFEFDEEIDDEL